MPENLQATLDVFANVQPATQQIKAFSDKNLRNIRLGLSIDDSNLKKGSSALGQIGNNADQFTKSMAAANARVLAFGTAVSVIEVMRRSFVALVKTTVEVEEALTKISVVAGDDLQKAGLSISQFGKQIFQVARETGQSFDITQKATLEFARQGIGVQESLKRTKDALILARVSGVDYGTAVDGLTSTVNAFRQAGLDTTTIINKLVAVDNNAAASLEDLIQGLQRSASVSQLTGQSIDQTIATIATLQEITARGGPQIGNSLKSIFTRIYDEKSLTFLKDFGVEVKDSAGQIKPAIDLIQGLAEKLNGLPKEKQLGILKDISGLYQVNAAAALTGQAFKELNGQRSIYQKNLETSTGATNEAVIANKKLSEILSSQFNTLAVNVGEIFNKFGELGVKNPLAGILDFLIKIQGTIQGILEGSGPLDKLVQGIVKISGGALFSTPVIAGGTFVLIKIIKDFISFASTAFQTFTGINKKLNDEGSLVSEIGSKLKANTSELNSAYGTEQRKLSLIKSANAEYSKQLALTSGIANASNRPIKGIVDRNLVDGAANVRKSGGVVGDVSNYLPTIIGGKSDNLASKLGSSISNTRATPPPVIPKSANLSLGQPSIPTGLRNKKGQFIDTSGISNALGLLINSWVFAGKESLEMGNLIRKAVGDFNLGQAFKTVSKAANDFAQGLIRDRNSLNKQAKAAIPGSIGQLNTSGTGFTSSAQFAGLGFRNPATEVSKVGLGGFPNIAALPQFDSERLALKSATEQRLRIDTKNRIAGQQELAQKLRGRDAYKEAFNRVETRRGEAQRKLNELKSGQSNTVDYGLQGAILRKDAIKQQAGEVAYQATLAKQLRTGLKTKDKELYEKYGIDTLQSPKTVISETQKADQAALAERLRNKFGSRAASNRPLLDGGNTLAGLRRSDSIREPEKTGITSDAFKNFAFKTIAVTALFQGLSSSLRDINPSLDKFANFLDTASLAGGGIAALNEVGGVSFKSLPDDFKAFNLKELLPKAVGGKLAAAAAPLLSLGAGLLRFLPIIGQVGLGFSILNSAIKELTGTSIIDAFSQALGGLTDEAKKAGERFKEISNDTFDPQGKYTGRSISDRQSSLVSTRQEALQRIAAKKQGIKIDGKTPKEIAAESFGKLLSDSVANIETGGIISNLSMDEMQGPRRAVIDDLSSSAKKILNETLAEITSGTLDELKANALALGITKIGDIDTASATREQIQIAVAKLFTEQLIKAYSSKDTGFGKNTNFDALIQDKLGSARLSGFAFNFLEKGKPKPSGAPAFEAGEGPTPESKKKFFDFQKDLLESIYSGAANQIEAEIKRLDLQSSNPSLTDNARRTLELKKDELLKQSLSDENKAYNAQFKNRSQLIQSQVGVNDKTQQDADRELIVEKANLANVNAKYKDSISLLEKEAKARRDANNALDRFTTATNAAQSVLSALSVVRAINNQKVSALESASNDPTINVFEQEGLKRAATQERINDLQQNGFKTIKEQARLAREEAKQLPLDKRQQKFNEINNSSRDQTIGLQTQISELQSSLQQIGKFADASTELTNSLTSFERGLPSGIAQNKINTLQATDASSLAGGLISEQVFGQAGGKRGQELVAFLADQNTLLNEQFKINTASNATEKLELETQLALTKEILDIKTQELDPLEKQKKIEEAINKNLQTRRGFEFGVLKSRAGIQSEIQNFGSTFGETATNGFRDGLVSAMQAVVSQTDDLRSALLNVALSFSNSLRDAIFKNLADLAVNSLTKGSSGGGGIIGSVISGIGGLFSRNKRATGGMISGGSGVKDDVPTLLMGGEYVMPKSTVQEYGRGFFDSLRSGSIGKMAQGGFFAPGIRGQDTITGKQDLLDFATQTATSGRGDVTANLGNGAAIASFEPESLRLSNFARFGDSPIVQATQETKEQAFGLYLQQLNNEKEYQAQLEAAKKAKSDQKKQLLLSLGIAAVGSAISFGFGGKVAAGAKSVASKAKGSASLIQRISSAGSSLIKSAVPSIGSSIIKTNSSSDGFYNPYPSASTLPSSVQDSGGYENPLFSRINVNGQYRNSGGYVGGNGDAVPAMLSNKEFVLNSSAAQKLGDKNLYALNNGGTPSSGGDSDERVIAKLDELIQKTIGASNVSVTVNMDSSGNGSSKEESSSSDSDSQKNQRDLSKRIKDTVVNILREEKRPGGILSK